MIIREKEPANLEMPFGLLDGVTTPNELFYDRGSYEINHCLPVEVVIQPSRLMSNAGFQPAVTGLEARST